jgi:exosome complex exonuclease DIS3/RRP44
LYIVDSATLYTHVTVFEQLSQDPVLHAGNLIFLHSELKELAKLDSKVSKRIEETLMNGGFFVMRNENMTHTYVGEEVEDRPKVLVQRAAEWYRTHLAGVEVVVVSPQETQLEVVLRDSGLGDMFPVVPPEAKSVYEPYSELEDALRGVRSGDLIEGSLHVYRNTPGKAWVRIGYTDHEVVIPDLLHRNRAIDGDWVAVQILFEATVEVEEAEEEGVDLVNLGFQAKKRIMASAVGKVVRVLRPKNRVFCGSVELGSRTSGARTQCSFMAIDNRVPNIDIYVRTPQALVNKRVRVVIDSWAPWADSPSGHLVEILGDCEDVVTESNVILLEHDVVIRPFTTAALACLPSDEWTISSEELAKRADLRSIVVCSVDPPGCKDIDDALHCRVLPNGNLEAGVHIADVTHFVKAGSALDVEASERGTTVYLVERRTDMLPSILTETLCSLVGGQERLAFSVTWEMHPTTYEILRVWHGKSVIKSTAALSYRQAQELIDSKDKSELAKSLRRLLAISKVLKAHRIEVGALELASSEVKFELDTDKLSAKNMTLYETFQTNSMVEEFMLLANVAVAQRILEAYPAYSILRRHPTPKEKELESLKIRLGSLGYSLGTETSKALADSLNLVLAEGNPYFNKVVRMLVTRCMNQAVYFCSSEVDSYEYRHYGLAAQVYTHFTSPIRRYADVLVHRLLAAALDVESLPEAMTDRREMGFLCKNLNFRNRMSQFAQRASTNLHTYLVFKKTQGQRLEQAIVIDFLPSGLNLLLPRLGIEGVLEVVYEELGVSARLESGRLVQLYDLLEVRVTVSLENFRKSIALSLA